jgi:phosphoribosylamine-glycine ligase
MASVMPANTYPKTYQVNEKQYVMHSAAEDTSFQATAVYHAAITVNTYPKFLQHGSQTIKVNNATEEASARAKFGQA